MPSASSVTKPASTEPISPSATAGNPARVNASHLLPVVVLLAGWLLSGWMFELLQRDVERRQAEFFGERVAEAQAAIRVRMTAYVDALRGGTSFVAASTSV